MALKPITRQEQIIAGKDLEPITRMEKFLKKYGGSGGGSGGGMPSGGAPFQQLVTDADGKAVWEERLAYSNELPSVTYTLYGESVTLCRVSDEVPLNLPAEGETIKTWVNQDGSVVDNPTPLLTSSSASGDALVIDGYMAVFVTGDSYTLNIASSTLNHGTWFARAPFGYISGIAASPDATEPEISWDGNPGMTKTIDPKYLPDTLATKSDIETAIGNAIGGSY